MEPYERSLISPQIKEIFYDDNKLNISIKLYSVYNIYSDKKVLVNLIIKDSISNEIYKFPVVVKKDIFRVKIDKNDLRKIKDENEFKENIIMVEVSNTDGDIICGEEVKGRLWDEEEFSTELNYEDDNFNLIMSNKTDNIYISVTKEICINEIEEIQKYFDNLKILFKIEKDKDKLIDKNCKFKLLIDKWQYESNHVEMINENSYYTYFKVENEENLIEKILSEDVYLTTIVKEKNYKNKIERINKKNIYKTAYEVFKLKAKEFF